MGIGDLQHLLAQRKGTRSYERLSRDCGGNPGAKRLQQLGTQPIKNFPDPPTVEGLARGLGVTRTEVVLACARSLGVAVEHDDALSLDTAGLTPRQTDALRMVIAAMLDRDGGSSGDTAPIARPSLQVLEEDGDAITVESTPPPKPARKRAPRHTSGP